MRSRNIKYIPELDQLRGVAVLLVFYFHAIASRGVADYYFGTAGASVPIADSFLELIVINGFTGVSLFFVISGFIFTLGALQARKINWRDFYLNRILRIYPLYVLINLIAFTYNQGRMPITQLLLNLAGFGNFRLGYGIFDIVLWTISLELQFYLLFPFLFNLLKRQGLNYLWGLVAVLVLLRLIVRIDGPYLHDLVYWTLLGRLDQFLIGMILASIAHTRGWLNAALTDSKRLLVGLAVFGLALVGLQWIYTEIAWKYGESYFQVVWPTLEGLAWAAVAVCYMRLVRYYQPKWVNLLEFIGVISFSLYLLQYPVIKLLQRAGWVVEFGAHRFTAGMVSATLIALPVTILLSVITFNLIEKPPLKFRKQYAKRP